ncbi:MAG: hypothetical protein IPH84_08075 [Bacteroidales bacterium]|nr:hypothetical protein [Bacteroidales bacterium]
MKRIHYIILASFLVMILILVVPPTMAQEPPHPPTTGHGVTGNQSPGGTAPVGGGISILLALGAMYAGKKVFRSNSEE